jgi:hypothetical protein
MKYVFVHFGKPSLYSTKLQAKYYIRQYIQNHNKAMSIFTLLKRQKNQTYAACELYYYVRIMDLSVVIIIN